MIYATNSYFELDQSRQMLLGGMLARNARKCPDQEGIIFKDRRITYRELDQRVNCVANALNAKGIKKGDTIGLLMPNRQEMVEIFFAAAKIGAVSVPVNIRLAYKEMAYILNNAEAKILFLTQAYLEGMETVRKDLPLLQEIILLDGSGAEKNYDALLQECPAAPPRIRLQDDDPAFLIYTAGTTGKPKGAILSHKNLIVNAMTIDRENAYSNPRLPDLPFISPKVLSITPFFHVAGIVGVVKTLYMMVPMVIKDFEPLELLKTIESERITFLFLVPAMWQMVMNHPDFKKYDVSSIRTVAYGADITRNAMKEEILEAFPNASLYEAFGQTEMTATAVYMKHQDALRKEGSVGLPLCNVEVRVVNDRMEDVWVNEVGEIIYRGPGLFQGYYKNPEETEKAFEGGWFHSGDLVRRDEEGFIYVVDRKKDMIISGGENIYSAEVESVLLTHPKIREAAVIGVPDLKWGEAVKAFLVLEPGREATEDEVTQFCLENLARYKRPKAIEFLSALPRSATGKVLKRELRKKNEVGV
ncbi:MAG TPA: long-chain-fatty-acid--CoA ligase [Thermodesulfobacteriota bacterium]|nr:long-chain-fatty-acid--CoA ligase [Thermodesulfobacteriota bacterium]